MKQNIIFILKKETYIEIEATINPNYFIGNKEHPITAEFLGEQDLIEKQNQILTHVLSLPIKNQHFYIIEHQYEYVQQYYKE